MVQLITQKERRQAYQRLRFCYLCGRAFRSDDIINRDHVPPESVFAKEDREPLLLPTHAECNRREQLLDEKVGQLIGLKLRHRPGGADKKPARLQIAVSPDLRRSAVVNIQLDDAVWRWVRGFHAALYGEPFPEQTSQQFRNGALVTPFPRAQRVGDTVVIEPLLPQHANAVKMIKWNRARGALDRIIANNGQLIYECLWDKADDGMRWLCFFAINVYDWKDLGRTPTEPARGCAGIYVVPGEVPATATVGSRPTLELPNYDPLDPFGL